MAESAKTSGVGLDLQALHACGADCGGAMADLWLAYRPGRRASHSGSIYDRVRILHARLGRRVRAADLVEAESEYELVEVVCRRLQALEQRRVAATPATLPPGPAPVACVAVEALPLLPRVRRPRPAPSSLRRHLPAVPKPSPVERHRIQRELRRWQLRVRALKALLRQWGDA